MLYKRDKKHKNKRQSNFSSQCLPQLLLATLVTSNVANASAESTTKNILDLSLEELAQVQVTVASLFPSNLLQAGSSLAVIHEQDWQLLGSRNISDVLATVPGVSVVPSLSGSDAYAIRGYTRNTSLFGVALTWDGVPLNDYSRGAPALILPRLNLGAINKIEMIEGPGSALYGSDAFHGVIALHPYEADGDQKEISSSLGSDGYRALNLRQSHQSENKIHTSVAISLDAQANQQLGFSYTDPANGVAAKGERANSYGAQTASIKFHGDAEGEYRWRSGFLLHHFDGDGFQGFGSRVAGARDFGGINTRFYLSNVGVEHDLSSTATIELSAYGWWTENDFTAGRKNGESDFFSIQHRYGSQILYRQQLPDINTNWAFALGAENMGIETAKTSIFDLNGTQLSHLTYPAEDSDRYTKSATFEGNTHFAAEQWRVIYGVRLDHYSDFNNHTSPRLGLIWLPQPDKAIKLLYGNAFHAPAANDLMGVPGVIAGNKNLQPEIINTFELVFMQQSNAWFNQLTLFRSHWEDGIVSSANTTGPLPFVRENAEDNRARGLTWEIKWQPTPWFIKFGASWVESENTTQNEDYSAFPRYILNLETGYYYQPWRTRISLGQLCQFDTDDGFAPSAGFSSQRLPTYSRTDIGITHNLGENADLQFFIRNLFDRDNFLPSGAGSRGGIPDEQISVSAGFRYGF